MGSMVKIEQTNKLTSLTNTNTSVNVNVILNEVFLFAEKKEPLHTPNPSPLPH